MSGIDESLILCEGFDDRDFLAGWFAHACGWRDYSQIPAPKMFMRKQVPPRLFLLDSPAGTHRIGILPVGGRERLGDQIRRVLDEPVTLRSLTACADIDQPSTAGSTAVVDLVRTALQALGAATALAPPWSVNGVQITAVSIGAGSVAIPGLDSKERLERLVLTAFARAWPARWATLQQWLANIPDGTGDRCRAAHWSVMAGWFPDGGCSDYLRRAIWQDSAMREQLTRLLAQTGLLEVTRRLTT